MKIFNSIGWYWKIQPSACSGWYCVRMYHVSLWVSAAASGQSDHNGNNKEKNTKRAVDNRHGAFQAKSGWGWGLPLRVSACIKHLSEWREMVWLSPVCRIPNGCWIHKQRKLFCGFMCKKCLDISKWRWHPSEQDNIEYLEQKARAIWQDCFMNIEYQS